MPVFPGSCLARARLPPVSQWAVCAQLHALDPCHLSRWAGSYSFVAPFMPNTPVDQLTSLVVLGELATLAIVQLYRYRRVSSSMQRQQTKWVVLGIAVLVTVSVGESVLKLIFPVLASPGSLYSLAFNVLGPFLVLLIPLSFGFAILRFRLYDIDLIIHRTLLYSTLTFVL